MEQGVYGGCLLCPLYLLLIFTYRCLTALQLDVFVCTCMYPRVTQMLTVCTCVVSVLVKIDDMRSTADNLKSNDSSMREGISLDARN